MERIYVTGFVRDPTAVAVGDDRGRWWVHLSPGQFEEVLPDGVLEDPGLGTRSRTKSAPAPLGVTLHAVVRHLRDVVLEGDPDDEEAMANAFAEHFRRFSVPSLCGHGRLPWGPHEDDQERPTDHSWAPPAGCGLGAMPDGDRLGLRVRHLERMITTMTTLVDASDHLHRGVGGLSGSVVDDILRWPILEPHLHDKTERERRPDRGFDPAAGRRFVARVVWHLLAGSAVQMVPRWPSSERLHFAFAARTTTGAYALDLARHLNPLDESDWTYICSGCGGAFTPGRPLRSGEGRFCPDPVCRAARKARNNRAARRRQKEHDGEHPEAS